MKAKIDDLLKFKSLSMPHENVWDYDLDYIANKDVSQVQGIYLWGNNITWIGISHLARCDFSNLKLIQLDRNTIGNKGVKYLSKIKCPNIQQINLCQNSISFTGVLHLSKTQWLNLKILWLNGNKINTNGIRYLNKGAWISLKKLNLYETQLSIDQCLYILINYQNAIDYLDLGKQFMIKVIFDQNQKAIFFPRTSLESFKIRQNKSSSISKHLIDLSITAYFQQQSVVFIFYCVKNDQIKKYILFMNRESQSPRQQKQYFSINLGEKKGYNVKNMLDNRHQVKDILQYPRNIVGYVKTSFYRRQDKKKQLIGCVHGSGVLIAPNIALTSAHNLFAPNQDYVISKGNIKFILSHHQYLGHQYKVKSFKSPKYYQQTQQKQQAKKYDFAILYLDESNNNQIKMPQIKIIWKKQKLQNYFNNSELIEVATFGYPSDLNINKVKSLRKPVTNQNLIGYQYESKGYLFKTEENSPFIEYNMYAKQGQSGSPIFIKDQQGLKLIGIHKGERHQICYGISLWSMNQYIQNWAKEQEQFKNQQQKKQQQLKEENKC